MHLFEKREKFASRGIVISILVFALIAILFVAMLGQIRTKSDSEQVKLLEEALRRAAITCYAIEGRYPPSIQYIMDHFLVIIDDEKYIVSYDVFASNVMPSINVLNRNAAPELDRGAES